MRRYTEDKYLMLSGIQHFIFCRRQWALIHIEQQWEENFRTVDGDIMHRKAHDDSIHEKRGNLLIVRGMAVSSPWLGISGECDVVEFRQDRDGVEIHGQQGRYSVTPVEYKRGAPKMDLCDKMQLAAQAMCLEDMLCCNITTGYLYYGETRRRLEVNIDDELRAEVRKTVSEMHSLFEKSYTPKVKRTKACNACSLKNVCLPELEHRNNVSSYLKERLNEDK